MKKTVFILLLLFVGRLTQAQWLTNGSNLYYNSGNVGIGTSSPQALLHLSATAAFPRYYVQSSNPSGAPGYTIADVSGAEKWTWAYNIAGGYMTFFLAGGLGDVMIINNSGNVGIGTTNPYSYKLAVNGTAIFTQVVVKSFANWPDYVFQKNYNLPSLTDVSKYIQVNHHLPDMPSADSIQKTGIDLGSNQTLFLKKIEELTLYLIQQDQELNELKAQNKQLKNQNVDLQTQNDRISRLEQLMAKSQK